MNPQAIIRDLFPEVEWKDADTGYMPCPGRHLHTHGNGKRDCQIKLNGAPTIFCFHQSCQAVIEEANYKMRRALWDESSEGVKPTELTDAERARIREQMRIKREEEEWRKWASENVSRLLNKFHWTPEDVWHESPITTETPDEDWKLMLSLYKPDDTLWIGEPKDSGMEHHRKHFKPVHQWMNRGPAGHFTCPAIFKADSFSRCNENVTSRPFLVIESDTLTQPEMCALTRWLQGFMILRAMLFTGGKSIHSWFTMPSPTMFQKLKTILPAMGCDDALFKPSQPVRLPGVKRGEAWQHLLWFQK